MVKKYGAEWVQRAERDEDHAVNERVVHKLGIRPPSAALVQKYLLEIAKMHNLQWTPTEKPLTEEQMAWQSMPAPSGATVPMAPGTAFSHLYTNTNINNKPGGGGDGAGGAGGGGGAMVPNPLPQQPPPSSSSFHNNNGGGGLDILAAPTTVPVATPISPPPGTTKEGFVPLPPAPAPAPAPASQPPAPAPSAPAEEEDEASSSAVYDIPLPPSEPPVLPPPDLPAAPATTGSGDHLHLGVSGERRGRRGRPGGGEPRGALRPSKWQVMPAAPVGPMWVYDFKVSECMLLRFRHT